MTTRAGRNAIDRLISGIDKRVSNWFSSCHFMDSRLRGKDGGTGMTEERRFPLARERRRDGDDGGTEIAGMTAGRG